MALGLFLGRMPPFFPRPTAAENTLAFPIFSEEAFTHIKQSLSILKKNLVKNPMGKKSPMRPLKPKIADMPLSLAGVRILLFLHLRLPLIKTISGSAEQQ